MEFYRVIREVPNPSQLEVLQGSCGMQTELVAGMQALELVHYGEDGPGIEMVQLRRVNIDDQYMRGLEDLQDWAADELCDMLMAGIPE